MPSRKLRPGSLTDLEVGVTRNLLARGYKNQVILGLINTVRRLDNLEETNGGRISEVKTNKPRYSGIAAASDEITDDFIHRAEMPTGFSSISTHPLDRKRLEGLFPHLPGTDQASITETDCIECKKTFGTQYLISNCLKAIAAFANNKGGYLVFGITDKTWIVNGIDGNKFRKLDRKNFNQSLLSCLSCAIDFEMTTHKIRSKTIGIMYVHPAKIKPVIGTKGGSDGVGVGHIYYRYQAENRLIGPTELQQLIEDRIRNLSQTILTKHLSNILENGIENSAILNIESGEVDGKAGKFLIDEELLPKISFVKEGEFVEKSGKATLRLIGDLKSTATVVKTKTQSKTDKYPYSWMQVAQSVKTIQPTSTNKKVSDVIKAFRLKEDPTYSEYSFTTKQHEEKYRKTGKVPKATTSIYNQKAIDFIANEIKITD